MVVKDFEGRVLFLDTSPLIYFIEGHTEYQGLLLNLFTTIDKGDFSFITSTLTLLEVLVKPLQDGRHDIVSKYTDILTTAKGIEIFDINISVSKEAAKLRAKYNLRTPDAIQLGTAIVFGASIFLTNDMRLKSVTEIKVVTLSEIE